MNQEWRLYLVDDDPDDRELAFDALAECGVDRQAVFFASGEALLDALREAPTHPSLVVLDWNMPRKNGLETLEELRSDHDPNAPPVVILTTSHDPSDREAALAAGASSFLTKPVSYEALVTTFRTLLVNFGWTPERR